MRLSDIMSQMGLASYAEAGLILFLLAFVAIAVRTWRLSSTTIAECAKLPLDDSPGTLTDQPELTND
jgi:hypothetical protein